MNGVRDTVRALVIAEPGTPEAESVVDKTTQSTDWRDRYKEEMPTIRAGGSSFYIVEREFARTRQILFHAVTIESDPNIKILFLKLEARASNGKPLEIMNLLSKRIDLGEKALWILGFEITSVEDSLDDRVTVGLIGVEFSTFDTLRSITAHVVSPTLEWQFPP